LRSLEQLWHSLDEAEWRAALDHYWTSGLIRSENMALEYEMERLDVASLRRASAKAWYTFLLERYFRWKYTAPNRYATTTKQLHMYLADGKLEDLDEIRRKLFAFDINDVRLGLKIAFQIRGLGVAGASGLLAVLFPSHFGTVDQFVVKSLRTISGLSESQTILNMNAENLRITDGVTLIKVMRTKARQLNESFELDYWTPCRVDMILWVNRQ
jgi:hypothetical protein